ncbi:MAG: hypothetical protein J1F35_04720 [Erysipelotrichales bacterium]|nr:hypothetical protein [Erysipelotrichales bacterium]
MNGKQLVSYSLDLNKSFKPHFSVNDNSINISYDGFIITVTKYYNQFLKLFKDYLRTTDDLKNYIAIFGLSHELEHAYQACIKADLVVSPSIMLESCYKMFFNSKHDIFNYSLEEMIRYFIRVIMYGIHDRKNLALERNANLEATDSIYKLASLEANEDLIKLTEELRMSQALMGYNFNGDGVLVNTAKSVLHFDKLQGFEEINSLSFEEKVRYGLPINENERENLFQAVLQSEEDRFLTLKKHIKINYVSE